MRVTQRSGRTGTPKHNDRSFNDLPNAQNRVELWTCYGKDISFADAERRFYEEHYSRALELTNQSSLDHRHPERVRTMDQVLSCKRTRPEEVILQIGDMNEAPDFRVFIICVNDYWARLREWNREHGDHMHILDFAIHRDETTIHAHMRRVWDYEDANGIRRIGQNKALEAAGVELPDPSKPLGRYNNRKITVDQEFRKIWQEVCIEHGLDIETEPRPGRKHKDTQDFIIDQQLQAIETNREMLKTLDSDVRILTQKRDELEESISSSTEERDAILEQITQYRQERDRQEAEKAAARERRRQETLSMFRPEFR